jgi:hypothetical protein
LQMSREPSPSIHKWHTIWYDWWNEMKTVVFLPVKSLLQVIVN